jgi:hypothetical protein
MVEAWEAEVPSRLADGRCRLMISKKLPGESAVWVQATVIIQEGPPSSSYKE